MLGRSLLSAFVFLAVTQPLVWAEGADPAAERAEVRRNLLRMPPRTDFTYFR